MPGNRIGIVTWNHIIVSKVQELDRNTWNHIAVLKLFVSSLRIWRYNSSQNINIIRRLKVYNCVQNIRIKMEYLESYNCVQIISPSKNVRSPDATI